MKYKLAKPLLFLIAFILVVGLACIKSTPEPAPVAQPAVPVAEEPAEPAAPVAQPVEPSPQPIEPSPEPAEPASEPVAEPATVTGQEFYKEEFTGDTSLWTYFLVDGTKPAPLYVEDDFGTMFVGTKDERLVFQLESEGQWAYVTYGGFEYEDVRLDVVADNRGVNNNNVSLICRYTPEGWYEFNIANNGLYDIYYTEILSDDKVVYNPLKNGGSNKIKTGKEVNEYTIICKGKNLSLFVNGKEAISFNENDYALRKGKVGVGVASFDTLPVKVEVDSVTISQP